MLLNLASGEKMNFAFKNMYIKEVKIRNIRSIKEVKLSYNEPYAGWHVLIGDNGSGKSSILKSICLALIGIDEAESLREDWSKWINKKASEAEVSISLVPDYEFDFTTKRKKAEIVNNKIIFKSNKSLNNIFLNNAIIEALKDETDPSDYNWGAMHGWFSAAYGPYRKFGGNDITDFSSSHPRASAHLSAFGEETGLKGCIDWLTQLRIRSLEKDNADSKVFSNLLSLFVRFINNSELLPYNSKVISVTTNEVLVKDIHGNEVSIFDLSDGYRTILSMTFDIVFQLLKVYGINQVFNNIEKGIAKIDLPGVILIDEIDAHLHPKWQIKIGEWFKKIFPRIQFIVTTHSPLICRSVKDNNSIWLLPSIENENNSYREVLGSEKEKLILGNILDAYGTDIFGRSTVRSRASNESLELLGRLNMLMALGKITNEEKIERDRLLKIFSTDDPISK